MNERDFDSYLKLHYQVESEANKIYQEYLSIKDKILGEKNFRNLEFVGTDGLILEFRGDEYWSYGGHEHHYDSLPVSYLYNENWKELATDQLKKIKEENQKKD